MRQSRCLPGWVVLITFLTVPQAMAQSAAFSVVNAASYGGSIAPDSLATIFGTNFSVGTASATLDSNGQLPTVLAQTSVQINGAAAALFFVSPTQINLVVPAGLSAGTATVVIQSTISSSSQSGTALVRTTAPGLFTTDASGGGPGAILNAINYQPAPFLVLTDNGGSGVQTRLAVYGTGLRNAGTVTALAQDPSGNRYPMTVEFAGAAPGFFGLDQVNVVLPPQIDGAGTVSLLITADGFSANPVTFQMDFIPAILVRPSTLTLDPNVVTAGDSSTLTVGLTGVARTNGYLVGLQSSNAAAPVVTQVTVPPGSTSAQTTIKTAALTSTVQATIAATGSGVTLTAKLEIDPVNTVQLVGLSVPAALVLGGRNVTVTVTLTGAAPAAGVNVQVASDSDKVVPPAMVTVPFGKSSADFTIVTLPVTSSQTVTLTATLNRTSSTATVTLLPPLQLTLDAAAVVGGNPVNGTVTLGDPPAGSALVTLTSVDTAAQVSSVSIPAGQNSATFTVNTLPVSAARTVTITAIYGLLKQSVLLTLNPPPAPTLSTLTISPNPVPGGTTTQGTITLTSAAGSGGVRVTLQSSAPLTANVSPNFLIIPQGQISGTFLITTTRFTGTVTITATTPDGATKTATLTVQ